MIRFCLAAAAVSLLGSTALAGTLTEGKPYDGTTIKALLVKSSQFEAQQKHLQEFTDKTGINVQIDYVPFPNMKEALSAEMVGGGDYDIVSVMDQWVTSMGMLLEPIDGIVERNKIDMDDYPQVFRARGYIGDSLVGLPIRGHVQLMFYRPDLLKEAGVEPPKTWAEVASAGRAVKDKTGTAGIAIPYGKLNGQNLMVWVNLLWGHGGDIFGADGKPAFNSDAGVAATQQYIDLLRKDQIVSEGAAAFTEQDAVNSFKQGHAAMLPVWWWVRTQLDDPQQSKLAADQIGYTRLPVVEGHAPTTYTNSWIFGVTQGSREKEAAMEFLSWVSDASLEKAILLDPKEKEVVAVHVSNLTDPQVNERWGGMHEAAYESMKDAPVIPYTDAWPRVSEILETAISSLASGESTDVKATLDRAAEDVAALR